MVAAKGPDLNYILIGRAGLCLRCCFGGTPPKRGACCSHCCFDVSPQQGACCSPRAICKQQLLCLLYRFSSLCVRHILVPVRCSLFDQHVSRRLPEHLPSELQFPLPLRPPRARCCVVGSGCTCLAFFYPLQLCAQMNACACGRG